MGGDGMDAVHGNTARIQGMERAGPTFHLSHHPFLKFPRDGFLGGVISESAVVIQHHGFVDLGLVLGDADVKANLFKPSRIK